MWQASTIFMWLLKSWLLQKRISGRQGRWKSQKQCTKTDSFFVVSDPPTIKKFVITVGKMKKSLVSNWSACWRKWDFGESYLSSITIVTSNCNLPFNYCKEIRKSVHKEKCETICCRRRYLRKVTSGRRENLLIR